MGWTKIDEQANSNVIGYPTTFNSTAVNCQVGDLVFVVAGFTYVPGTGIDWFFSLAGTGSFTTEASEAYDPSYDQGSKIYLLKCTSAGTFYVSASCDDTGDYLYYHTVVQVWRPDLRDFNYISKGTEYTASSGTTISYSAITGYGLTLAGGMCFNSSSVTATWTNYTEEIDRYDGGVDSAITIGSNTTEGSISAGSAEYTLSSNYLHGQNFTVEEVGFTINGVISSNVGGVTPAAINGI